MENRQGAPAPFAMSHIIGLEKKGTINKTTLLEIKTMELLVIRSQ